MAKEIKYPKYKREENLACKLNDEQIADIRKKKLQGWKIKELIKIYKVCKSTILYWTSEERRQKAIRRSSENNRKAELLNPEHFYELKRKSILRKKRIQGKEFNAYSRIHKNTERTKLRNKLAWEIVKRHKKEYYNLLKKIGG